MRINPVKSNGLGRIVGIRKHAHISQVNIPTSMLCIIRKFKINKVVGKKASQKYRVLVHQTMKTIFYLCHPNEVTVEYYSNTNVYSIGYIRLKQRSRRDFFTLASNGNKSGKNKFMPTQGIRKKCWLQYYTYVRSERVKGSSCLTDTNL